MINNYYQLYKKIIFVFLNSYLDIVKIKFLRLKILLILIYILYRNSALNKGDNVVFHLTAA